MIHFIYTSDPRDGTTGNYLLDAAKRIGIPVSWSSKGVPEGLNPTLVIKVDDGDIDNTNYSEICECPTAWWFIDPNTDFERGASIAQNFDYTFCSQVYGVDPLVERGINAHWLPCAADPVHHSTVCNNLEDRPFDVGFSGSIGDCGGWNPGRPELLIEISNRFKNSVIRETTKGQNSMLCGSCKVVFNDNPYNNINMRHFEAIASGAVLVTRRVEDNGMENIAVSNSVLFYDTPEEAMDRIKFALINIKSLDDSAKQLAEFYHQYHSYSARLAQINDIIKNADSLNSKDLEN